MLVLSPPILALVAQWAWVLASAAARGPRLVLDLTPPSVGEAQRALTWGCTGGGLGPLRPPKLPLALRLTSLDRETYRLGEEAISELVLTNTGGAAVRIPWSVDASLVFSKDCRWLPRPGVVGLHGSVTLMLEDESGKRDFVAGHNLFGVSSDPSTFRELAPGETMEIKMAGKVELHNIPMGVGGAGAPACVPVTVTANFALDDSPAFGRYSPVVSANSLRLTVQAE